MKKTLILALIIAMSLTSLFAEAPKSFGFEFGAGASMDNATGALDDSSVVGFTYSFNDTFRGGFNFNQINGSLINMINVSAMPTDDVTVTLYTGSITDTAGPTRHIGFGMGLGYDFFSKSDDIFTSLGVYLDWYASNANSGVAGAFSIEDGGVIAIGLKTRIGI